MKFSVGANFVPNRFKKALWVFKGRVCKLQLRNFKNLFQRIAKRPFSVSDVQFSNWLPT
jgi:hypothetical protein